VFCFLYRFVHDLLVQNLSGTSLKNLILLMIFHCCLYFLILFQTRIRDMEKMKKIR